MIQKLNASTPPNQCNCSEGINGWTKFLTSDNETWWHSTVRPRNAKAPSKRKTLSWKANKKGKFPKEPEVIWRD